MSQPFVHLNVHSEYSILDGVCELGALCKAVKARGMDAVALTDSENMFGMVKFYRAALEAEIKPIFGCEVNVAPRRMSDREGGVDRQNFKLLLLAKNQAGFRNLMKLVSESYLQGHYFKPRVDREILAECSEGLIALSSGIDGEIAQLLLNEQADTAAEAAQWHARTYGEGNYFLELQNHGLAEQARLMKLIPDLSRKTGIPMAATNDVHYIDRENAQARRALIAIRENRTLHEIESNPFLTDENYLAAPEEMLVRFSGFEEALAATAKIADMCDVKLDLNQTYLPDFDLPEGKTADDWLTELSWAGLEKKYPFINQGLKERAEMELNCIKTMGFSAYFLIVWDLIRYANEMGIPSGPGRGSVAGSIVAYALNITKVDPIKYGLQFERFLNPERVSMPDIDMDFCEERRSEVIEYARQKYGDARVAMIITFGRLKAKNAIRDAGRVMEIPLPHVDRIAKMVPMAIPSVKGVGIRSCIEHVEDIKEAYENDPTTRRLLDVAMQVEGKVRNTSTHAAGVVISKNPIVAHMPLFKLPDDPTATAALTMEDVEALGLLKMDFLGLRNLTVINNALKSIEKRTGKKIDIDQIPLDDKPAYKMLGEGNADGVFQFEGDFAKSLLRRQGPTCLDDLIALNALNRPGPIGGGMVDDYLERRKKEPDEIDYMHEKLEPALRDTLGVIVYQEQVMAISQVVANFSLAKADLMRRAMGKKKAEVMTELRSEFIEGAVANKFSDKLANRIFDLLMKFSEYGFNKSHCAAYSVVAYQTAWLKANYPIEFMAALLTSVRDSTDKKVPQYANNCKSMGIDIRPPDVNSGFADFTPHENSILYGMAAIKNVGANAVEAIVREREEGGAYQSIFDLCRRVDLNQMNKKTLESLIRSGACDGLGGGRAQKMAAIEEALKIGRQAQRDRNSGQIGLFDGSDDDALQSGSAYDPPMPDIPEFPNERLLADEKELLGVYLSMHPLDPYKEWIQANAKQKSTELQGMPPGRNVTVSVAGIVTQTRFWSTNNGEPMMFVDMEDYDGAINVVVPPENYRELRDAVAINAILAVTGRLRHRANRNGGENDPVRVSVTADQIVRYGGAGNAGGSSVRAHRALHLHLKPKSPANQDVQLEELQRILSAFRGDSPVYVHCDENGSGVTKWRLSAHGLVINQESLRYITDAFGEDYVWAEALPAEAAK